MWCEAWASRPRSCANMRSIARLAAALLLLAAPAAPLEPSTPLTSAGLNERRVVLNGHEAGVSALSFSPDGQWLVSAGLDGLALLWRVAAIESAQASARLEGHAAALSAAAFSPDGRAIATGSYDRSVRLWSEKTARPRRILLLSDVGVTCLAYSPDGRWLAVGGDDGQIRILKSRSLRQRYALRQPEPVRSLALSKGGWVAGGGDDGRIFLWNLRRPRRQRRQALALQAHGDVVVALTFSPDGATLASGGWDGRVRLWSADGKALLTLPTLGAVNALAWLPDGSALASGGKDAVRFWNPRTGRELRLLEAPDDDVLSLAVSPDGTTLAAGHPDGTISLLLLDGADQARIRKAPKPVIKERRRI